jgi:DNA polymerase-3 subunit gamma/tau
MDKIPAPKAEVVTESKASKPAEVSRAAVPASAATAKAPTLSITDFLGSKPGKNEADESGHTKKKAVLTNDYTPAEFGAAWKAMADGYRRQGRMNLYAALTKHNPSLVSEHHYLLQVDNAVVMAEVREARQDFIGILRDKLEHSDVQLGIEQVAAESNESDNRLYTTTDKYKRMVEKNPVLQDLKKQLDLEIEF